MVAGVVIIGRRSKQHSLLAYLVHARLGYSCQVRGIDQSSPLPAAPEMLALVDVAGMSIRHVNAWAPLWQAAGFYRGIALLNAEEGSAHELAYLPGVRGIFVRNASYETVLKGIRALMAGEHWLPRRVLAAHFERTRPRVAPLLHKADLTQKEAETLRLLTGGYSNGAIARHLGVSSHTVKTHVYNLSRKIGAHNRVQAAKWAMENLGEPAVALRYAGGGLDGSLAGGLVGPDGE